MRSFFLYQKRQWPGAPNSSMGMCEFCRPVRNPFKKKVLFSLGRWTWVLFFSLFRHLRPPFWFWKVLQPFLFLRALGKGEGETPDMSWGKAFGRWVFSKRTRESMSRRRAYLKTQRERGDVGRQPGSMFSQLKLGISHTARPPPPVNMPLPPSHFFFFLDPGKCRRTIGCPVYFLKVCKIFFVFRLGNVSSHGNCPNFSWD